MQPTYDRRTIVKGALLASAAAGLGVGHLSILPSAKGAIQPPRAQPDHKPKRSLRVAHITDMHIQPELRAFEGVAACLKHLNEQADKPELILTGGDLIMDSLAQDATRTGTLWSLWTKTLRDNNSLPVEHCLGNHDIWGWDKKKSGATGEEGKWGKRWALDALGLEKPYRTFEKSGWRFVVLDTVSPVGEAGGYIGKLDDEQFAWFEKVLAETPATTPVLVLGHIPILTVTAITKVKNPVVDKHEVAPAKMMSDMPRIVRLFEKHPNVKACISGHIHDLDLIDYQGVRYLCNGAVSGNWWKGRHDTCDEGYAMLDLYEDGRVERTYQTYGWKA